MKEYLKLVSDVLNNGINKKNRTGTDTLMIFGYHYKINLQNLDEKRIILPDKALQKLLRINKKDELTYFNLQKYMKVHFPNKDGVYPTL